MTTQHGGLDSGRLGYWHLLTPTGLRGQLALSRTTYDLGNTYSSLDAIGHANAVEGELTYPIVLTETHRLTGNVGASYNDLVDEVRSTGVRTPKKLEVVHVGVEYASVAPEVSTQAGASLTVGHLGFHDPVADAQDAAGADSQGNFKKLGAHLERRQALPGDLDLDVRVRARAQLGNKSLDGSQKLEVSGADGVIVYAPGELLGDTTIIGHLGLSRSFAVGEGVKLAPGVFLDEGWAHNHYAVAGTASSRTLGDVGLGLSAAYRSVTLQVQWASRTAGGKAVAEPTSRARPGAIVCSVLMRCCPG